MKPMKTLCVHFYSDLGGDGMKGAEIADYGDWERRCDEDSIWIRNVSGVIKTSDEYSGSDPLAVRGIHLLRNKLIVQLLVNLKLPSFLGSFV